MIPYLNEFLNNLNSDVTGDQIWDTWRDRQRIEQYQDNILMLGHSGYLKTCERALKYSLEKHGISFNEKHITNIMDGWYYLKPFEDAMKSLPELSEKYNLVALSNGEQNYLEHLAAKQLKFEFNDIISVQNAGLFKPSPAVYRKAANMLNKNVEEIMMVASHSFDIIGAKACGYKGAYINRYDLPVEYLNYSPDITVMDFYEFTNFLVRGIIPKSESNKNQGKIIE
jgi:2-haloacid dehalogenase